MVLGSIGMVAACGPSTPHNPSPELRSSRGPGPDQPYTLYEAPGPAYAGARVPAPESEPPQPPRPRAEELLSPALTESAAAAKLVTLITDVKANLVTTRYKHKTRVRRRTGYYAFDCSGMVAWMLQRTAPRAFRAMKKTRPRAIDFYDSIVRAPTAESRRGWRRLDHVSDARAGDLFAFPRSPVSTSPITGHVGVFIERPWPVDGLEDAWAARILDATRLPHQDDTRSRDGDGGFGFGTMMFVNDETGKTIAYGWFGTQSSGYMPTHVAYGRVTK